MTLEVLSSGLLDGVRHGFFTRRGGASSGIFEGLNCGLGSSDQREIVEINRARAAAAMGVEPESLVTVNQTHSARVLTVTRTEDVRGEEADGLVTSTPGLLLGILTADCQPVLFWAPGAGVVGAAHAGWKGAMDGVLEATIDAMEAQGADRSDIRAAIGPSISQASYEVGEEFLERFLDDNPATMRHFVNGKDGKYQFDLIGYGLARLRAAGVGEAGWIGRCTYAEPDRFYSYRRSVHRKEADYGRLISTIRL